MLLKKEKRSFWKLSVIFSAKIQVKYDPESEIVATVGATEAINAAIFTLLNPEDKILVPTPVFFFILACCQLGRRAIFTCKYCCR